MIADIIFNLFSDGSLKEIINFLKDIILIIVIFIYAAFMGWIFFKN